MVRQKLCILHIYLLNPGAGKTNVIIAIKPIIGSCIVFGSPRHKKSNEFEDNSPWKGLSVFSNRGERMDINLKFYAQKCRLTIQDALEKDESQYPHAPLRSISRLMLFLLLTLHSFFFDSFPLFLQQVNCNGRKRSLQISPSRCPFPSHSRCKEERKYGREEGSSSFPSVDCLLVQLETLYDPQLLDSFLPGPLTPLRTGPQSSRPPASERCPAWNMREVVLMRSGPAELCCRCWVRGWRHIGQSVCARTQLQDYERKRGKGRESKWIKKKIQIRLKKGKHLINKKSIHSDHFRGWKKPKVVIWDAWREKNNAQSSFLSFSRFLSTFERSGWSWLLAALETHSLFAASLRPVSNKHTHLPTTAGCTLKLRTSPLALKACLASERREMSPRLLLRSRFSPFPLP